MEGYVRLNGVMVLVNMDIIDGQIVLTVPKNTDLTNWYHAVYIQYK